MPKPAHLNAKEQLFFIEPIAGIVVAAILPSVYMFSFHAHAQEKKLKDW